MLNTPVNNLHCKYLSESMQNQFKLNTQYQFTAVNTFKDPNYGKDQTESRNISKTKV